VVQLVPGPAFDAATRKIAPHVVLTRRPTAHLMQREIFGPILPLRRLHLARRGGLAINAGPRRWRSTPSARMTRLIEQMLLDRVMSGGVSVNDALLHVGQHDLPFGGVGALRHGPLPRREGFETFSKLRPVSHAARQGQEGRQPAPGTPVWLLRTLLQALQQRNRLDTALVDDVVLGCVTPVGEQGADIARTAVLDAEWAQTVAGVTQSRFCASGLESVNLAAPRCERLGGPGRGRRRREHEPLADGQRRRRLGDGPARQPEDRLRAAGHRRRPDRHAGGLQPRRRRRLRAALAPARGRRRAPRAASPLRRAGADIAGLTMLDEDETIRPGTTMEAWPSSKPAFAMMGAMGFDATALRATPRWSASTTCTTPATAAGIVDGAALMLVGNEPRRPQGRPEAARAHPRRGGDRQRADHHAHRPHAGLPQGAGQGRHGRRSTSTCGRSTRPSPRCR
jgi:hypothetical protein